MSSPRLTIGMACFNDFDGVYFTIQAIRVYHPAQDVEIVVVDQGNNPSHSEMVKGLCSKFNGKYVAMPTPTGTSPSRNRVFAEATGEFVLCIDSHVLLFPQSIEYLLLFIQYQSRKPEHRWNLYSGPMIQDDLKGICTHFNYEWRSEMLGTWGRAWRCKCAHFEFSCLQARPLAGEVAYIPLQRIPDRRQENDGYPSLSNCPHCLEEFPVLGWAGHEAQLLSRGYYTLGINPSDEPFEIPGQGLGLFGCRKEAWLGFNQHASGFGGEELCIHELYRQKGYKTICLPYMQWLHRFGRPAGVPYPLDRYQKVRNYVLWFQQLDKPLDEIETHFVKSMLLPREHWDYLLADPINHATPSGQSSCSSCGQQPAPQHIANVGDAFDFLHKTPRDFNEHMPKLRELAMECESVTEFSIRRESAVALCASGKTVHSYNQERSDFILTSLAAMYSDKFKLKPHDLYRVEGITPTDLLFLNDKHTAERVLWQLETFAKVVSHYIVLHNTQVYGEFGEDGGPGILVACRQFMRKNPEWGVIFHTGLQHGLTVLSRKPEDKKRLPGVFTQVANFTAAMAAHIADGLTKVEPDLLEARLNICAGCEQRNEGHCGACGCPLADKAPLRSSECPLGLW